MSQAGGQRFHQQVHHFLRARSIGIPVRIVLRDIQAKKVFLFRELDERSLHFAIRKPTAAGQIDGAKFFLGDHVHIKVHHKFAGIGVELRKGMLRCARGAF